MTDDPNLTIVVTPERIRETFRDPWIDSHGSLFVASASDATLRDLAEGVIDKLWDTYHEELNAAVEWYRQHPEHWKADPT